MKKHILLLLLLTVVAVTGCGGNGFVPTGGRITFEDGTPVTSGSVAFETDNFMADGRIKPDGSYTLSSLKPGDGLPPGKYAVSVSSSETDANEKTIFHVDPKFANPATSGLTAEVTKGGKNQFDFKVDKPAK